MPRKTIADLEQKLVETKEKLEKHKTMLSDTKEEHSKKIENINNEHSNELKKLREESNNYKKLADERQKQLDEREIKKFAEAFAEQEENCDSDTRFWLFNVALTFALLIIAVIASAVFAQDVVWYERFEYYLINFILITFLVFTLKQYSYYKKLTTDYANRKVLAQSYHNILNSEEDKSIRSKFLDKITEVLAAKSEVTEEAHTLPEHVIKEAAKFKIK